MDCEFCKKTFSSIGILNRHKRTSKKCNNNEERIDLPQCKYCHKSFAQLDRHKCKVEQKLIEKLNRELNDKTDIIISHEFLIIELQEKVEFLKTALMNAQKEPRTVNITNNITLNIIDFKEIEKRLHKTLKDKTYKDLLGGIEPYMDIIASSFNTRDSTYYNCTDHSRQVFAFKDEKGNIKKEYNGETIFQVEDKVKPVALQKLTDRFNYWKNTPEETTLKEEMKEMEEKIYYMRSHQKGHKPSTSEYYALEKRISEMEDKLGCKNRQLRSLYQEQINQEDRDIEMEKLMKAKHEIRCVGKDIDVNKKCIRYLSKHPLMNT
jgi:hypothetical protein